MNSRSSQHATRTNLRSKAGFGFFYFGISSVKSHLLRLTVKSSVDDLRPDRLTFALRLCSGKMEKASLPCVPQSAPKISLAGGILPVAGNVLCNYRNETLGSMG